MKTIGRYEIVEELGRGATGVVYKASDPTIGRQVAIKVLSLENEKTEEGVPSTRDVFMREARSAGRLSHPGIVTIHDALEDPESHTCYIVEEFIPGRTLESIMLAGPLMTADKSLEIIRQIAEALDYAHRNQIIHRDLKPANIILTEDGRAKITDFGIAKIVARDSVSRTLAIMGTPAYMSPEQVRGGEVDSRSDLFSLGILLYLMLAGEKPFLGDTAAVMFKIVYEEPTLLSKMNPVLTDGHDYLVLRCLAKDQVKRYATAREFLEDLEDVRAGRPPRSEKKIPPSELRTADRTLTMSKPLIAPPPAAAVKKEEPRRPIAEILAGAAFLSLLGLGLWVIIHRHSPTSLSSAPAKAATVQTSGAPNAAPVGQPAAVTTPASGTASVGSQVSSPPAPAAGKLAPAQSPGKAATSKSPSKPTGATAVPPKTPPLTAAATAAPSSQVPPPAAKPLATKPVLPGRVVTLACKYELEEGTLKVMSSSTVIYQAELTGTKSGLLGKPKGELSRPITVPGDADELTLQVSVEGGSAGLIRKVAARPPSRSFDTLKVSISRKRLTAEWAGPPAAKK
jgi:serine/threonine-protein kinase